jgi:hypothetical protein
MIIVENGWGETGWSEVERLAQLHEAHVNKVMSSAGLPLVKITVQDRQRGAMIEAQRQLYRGDTRGAWVTLQEALKL